MNNEIHSAPGDNQDKNTLNDVNDWLNIGQEYDNFPPASPDGRGVGSDDYISHGDYLAQQKERIQQQILDLQEKAPFMGVTVAEAEIQALLDEYDRLVEESLPEELEEQ